MSSIPDMGSTFRDGRSSRPAWSHGQDRCPSHPTYPAPARYGEVVRARIRPVVVSLPGPDWAEDVGPIAGVEAVVADLQRMPERAADIEVCVPPYLR